MAALHVSVAELCVQIGRRRHIAARVKRIEPVTERCNRVVDSSCRIVLLPDAKRFGGGGNIYFGGGVCGGGRRDHGD